VSRVLDTSAILAFIWREPGGERVARHLETAAVSPVIIVEVVSKLIDRGIGEEAAELAFRSLSLNAVEFDTRQALKAAGLRERTRRLDISLADRACMALALVNGMPVMTGDRVWASLGLDVEVELIR
jgi:PIN domain nuclease of toxin-antitoxin system